LTFQFGDLIALNLWAIKIGHAVPFFCALVFRSFMNFLEGRMDSSPLLEQHSLAGNSEGSSLLFLLKRGLDYIQRGHDAEGVAILALAREQLSPDQVHLADVLDAFLEGYAGYRRIQQAFQEASTHFARAHAEQQARVEAFEKVLLTLIRGINTPHHSSGPLIVTNDRQLPPHLPSRDLQEPPPSLIPQSCMKDSTALPELSVTCFGRFEVRRLGKPIVLCSSRNGQSILRYLVVRSGHYATSDTLQTMLGSEDEPEVAKNKLHLAISALRRSLNDGSPCEQSCGYIVCKNRVYYLNPAATIRTDVDEFLQCYQAGQQRSEERAAFYERACRLYTGPFLPEDLYADWSFLQREELSQTYLAMCGVLTDHYLKIKRYEEAAKWAAAILQENRCDEAAHRQLMQIYAAQGRRSEAIQQYQRCERILHQELGVQPLPETVQLFQALLRGETIPTNKTAKI
jgi:DNA-binding SARP family transcriptional activator